MIVLPLYVVIFVLLFYYFISITVVLGSWGLGSGTLSLGNVWWIRMALKKLSGIKEEKRKLEVKLKNLNGLMKRELKCINF